MRLRESQSTGPRRRIKLVYVIDVLDTNLAGTENQLIRLINGLDRSCFDVSLVCLRAHAWLEQHGAMIDCPKTIVPIREFRKLGTYGNFVRLVRHFRRLRADVVHTFFPVSNIVAVLAAKLARVPVIVSSRRDFGEWMSPRYLAMTKFANRFVTAIAVNAESLRALTIERERIAPERVKVFLNGISADAYRDLARDNALKRRLGIAENCAVVGIVANFHPVKDHETFIRAAAEILRARSDVHFILVGGTASTSVRQGQLQALARELGIDKQLHFVGSQSNVRPYLSIMDVAVNSSKREGLSNAIMEYMAAGVPAVVTRAGGNVDLIVDEVSGSTFDVGDYQSLARQITRLLSDVALRQRFARAARQRIEQEMTDDVMLSRYSDWYQALAVSR